MDDSKYGTPDLMIQTGNGTYDSGISSTKFDFSPLHQSAAIVQNYNSFEQNYGDGRGNYFDPRKEEEIDIQLENEGIFSNLLNCKSS